MKYREVLRIVRKDGWYEVKQTGSHRHFKHPTKSGKVTIAGHPGQDVPPGVLNSILKQAQIKQGDDK